MPSRRWLATVSVLVLAGCTPNPAKPLSATEAGAIADSIRATLAAYADRMNATDRDSLLRFYDDDPRFTWTANGQVGTRSVAQVRTTFASLAAFTRWHIEYRNPSIVALAPGDRHA